MCHIKKLCDVFVRLLCEIEIILVVLKISEHDKKVVVELYNAIDIINFAKCSDREKQ